MTDQSAETPECRDAFEAWASNRIMQRTAAIAWSAWQAGWNARPAPAPAEAERGCDHIWAASNPDKTRRSEAVCAKCGISGHSASQPPQPATPALGVDGMNRRLEDAIDAMTWNEINAFRAELAKGQDIREDAGGYFLRCIKRLFGIQGKDEVTTYQDAARALLKARPE